MSKITNILVVGTGGQGVMTATEILAEAAIAFGHDVKKTEVAGMAQRGGVAPAFWSQGAVAADYAGNGRCAARL
ncbi:MAG: 2-oxoacid:acceptor oxidoreductase family protein [Afipia sp.]|nr:2-oxoacid:acceptor oxidoreductase family protein [Afipia sp.]